MTLSPMEPNVSNISCPGHKSIRVSESHEERPSATRKISFQAPKQASGRDYIVGGPDSSIGADQRLAENRG
jgi:hypothetical protein